MTGGYPCCCDPCLSSTDCVDCTSRPSQYQVVIQGVGNSVCDQCGLLNQTYVLDQTSGDPCIWELAIDVDHCPNFGASHANLVRLRMHADGLGRPLVDVEIWGGLTSLEPMLVWRKVCPRMSDDCVLDGEVIDDVDSNVDCSRFGSTATVTAL